MVPVDSDEIPRVSPYSGYWREIVIFRLQDFHLLWFNFPSDSTISKISYSYTEVLLPQLMKSWFGLFPLRSPLLRESIFLSLPPVTKMFQFTGFPSYSYVLAAWWQNFFCRVSPFGYPWINTCLQFPMAFRSLPRPSSALDAKAFTLRSCSLDRITFVMFAFSFFFCFLKICSQLFFYSKIVFFYPLKVCFCFFTFFRLLYSFQCA